MSFKESVIIPLSMYQECLSTVKQDTVPPTPKRQHYKEDNLPEDNSFVLLNFPLEDRPDVRKILHVLESHKDDIFWNKKDQTVTVDGIHYPNSNIIDILQYLRGDLPPSSDVPEASRRVYDTLLRLKLPKRLVLKTPPRPVRRSVTPPPVSPLLPSPPKRRPRKRKSQTPDYFGDWTSFSR